MKNKPLESLCELYKIGAGPSSSHTMGPQRVAILIRQAFPDANHFRVTLYGSLALTGRGHLTDVVLQRTFAPHPCEVVFDHGFSKRHPNNFIVEAYLDFTLLATWHADSIGGGSIQIDEYPVEQVDANYPWTSMEEMKAEMSTSGCTALELVDRYDPKARSHVEHAWSRMVACIERGLRAEGTIPGALGLEKVAGQLHAKALDPHQEWGKEEREKMLLSAYAYAVSEENASGNEVVIAPTCGAAGVVSAVMYFFATQRQEPTSRIVDALLMAGIFGNFVKRNATISGAKGGCQAEVGTACSMAAAGASYLYGLDFDRIEYAAEVAMEHHLGLTCDPVLGFVQIPCIERNGAAALRALDAALYGKHIGNLRKNRVSFDDVVAVMKETGAHLRKDYRETALGGLAKKIKRKFGL
jgi:L-serine dehydratase